MRRPGHWISLGGRLRHIHVHDAFCLLCHAFALPKVLYILRTASCFQSFLFQNFDTLLRTLLGEIANNSINDLAWVQASLPVLSGGLGVRSTTQLAPSAFLASAAGCAGIISQMLPHRLTDAPYQAHDDALKAWSAGLEDPPCAYTPFLMQTHNPRAFHMHTNNPCMHTHHSIFTHTTPVGIHTTPSAHMQSICIHTTPYICTHTTHTHTHHSIRTHHTHDYILQSIQNPHNES